MTTPGGSDQSSGGIWIIREYRRRNQRDPAGLNQLAELITGKREIDLKVANLFVPLLDRSQVIRTVQAETPAFDFSALNAALE